MTALATLAVAKAALLTAIDDSRTEYAGDTLLDVAEEQTAIDLLDRCERASKADYAAALLDQLVATLQVRQ